MSEPKKPASKTSKSVNDVAHPGKSAPADTSRPIITPRPIMKDPMVVVDEAGEKSPSENTPKPLTKSEIKIEPVSKTEEKPETKPKVEKTDEKTEDAQPDKKIEDKPEAKPAETVPEKAEEVSAPEEAEEKKENKEDGEEEKAESEAKEEGEEDKAGKPDKDGTKKSKKPDEEAEAAAQAEKDAQLQKLIDSKKYVLPINAVEHRRNARAVILGCGLAIILAVAWADIALDAGLIQINGVKPITHFFST